LQMHGAESGEEVAYAERTRGATTVRHLDRLGVLGPGFLAAHAVFVDQHEIELLAGSGSSVAHNPVSNLRVCGIPPIAEMVDAGVNVAIGTDSAGVNNRVSVIDEMWVATMLQKGSRRDPTVLPARQTLAMGTCDGAQGVVWEDEIGSLTAGAKADLVLVETDALNMLPLIEPVSGLVNSMAPANVVSVMCDGKWVLRDRRLTNIDEPSLRAEIADRTPQVLARAGIDLDDRVDLSVVS
ncbi:MAG: amidohydrolase family protein, partial [Solirubrobacterales bacterium]